MGVPKDYEDCYAYLSAQFPEVGGCEFYSELFPDNEKAGELHTDFSRPNAIYLYRDEARGRGAPPDYAERYLGAGLHGVCGAEPFDAVQRPCVSKEGKQAAERPADERPYI